MGEQTQCSLCGPKNGLATRAYGILGEKERLGPLVIKRRHPLLMHDVLIDIVYCGICHSDIHAARNEWGGSIYPMVPGHEITGFVKDIGSGVTKFKIGQKCAVGVFVNTCHCCSSCKIGLQQYCVKGLILTYNSHDAENECEECVTYGGYSTEIVVNENYVFIWPDNLPMQEGAPLLCAGITVYSPLKYCKVTSSTRVGVVGLGGLGHMAVRFAHALGAFVCVLSRGKSEGKKVLAAELGANDFIATEGKDANEDMKKCAPLDVIIDTVSADHDIGRFANMLKVDGTYVIVGVPPSPLQIMSMQLCLKRLKIMGSAVGSLEETQEMLNFCAEKQITCLTECITIDKVNEAYDRVVSGDVKFRFVIDIKSSNFDK